MKFGCVVWFSRGVFVPVAVSSGVGLRPIDQIAENL